MALENIAEEYFSKLNPIATRMHVDMQEIKLSYEDLWSTLSEDNKKEILSEGIIKPEISIQYRLDEERKPGEYAVKRVVDDHYTYRDEHSGPFSFKTPSQRDLTIFVKQERPQKPKKLQGQFQKPVQKKTEENSYTNTKNVAVMEATEEDCTANLLPKTGLDFLDNW